MKPIDKAWSVLKSDMPEYDESDMPEYDFTSRIGQRIKQLMDEYGLTVQEAMALYRYMGE